MVSAWGSTETSPLATQVHFPIDRAGVIGLPIAGSELAFVPHGDKLEMRLRGPQVSPGSWQPGGGIEPLALDAEGFWPTGDAGRLEDDAHPERGVRFEGRLGENFKLASGTWVSVGQVRLALIAAFSPYVSDAVITGHDRDELGALLFLAPGHTPDTAALTACHARHLAEETSSSKCVQRLRIAHEPPDLGAGEITDKGYLNQRAILQRRSAEVDALYAPNAPTLQ
jgi:feruloyl-CoA synthase